MTNGDARQWEPLIAREAWRLHRMQGQPHVDLDDMIGEARLSLVRAWRDYDGSTPLVAFLSIRVRQDLMKLLQREHPSWHARELAAKIRRTARSRGRTAEASQVLQYWDGGISTVSIDDATVTSKPTQESAAELALLERQLAAEVVAKPWARHLLLGVRPSEIASELGLTRQAIAFRMQRLSPLLRASIAAVQREAA